MALTKNWLAFLGTGSLMILLSWMLSGCRLGNRVQAATDPDPITGYYETAPQSLAFSSNLVAQAVSRPPNEVPDLIAVAFTNPVAVIMQDLATGEGAFVPVDGTRYAFPFYIDSQRRIGLAATTQKIPVFGTDTGCTRQYSVLEDGQLTQAPGPSTVGFSKPIHGRVELDIQVILSVSGESCDSRMAAVQACYNDASLCGGADSAENETIQAQYFSLFAPYIRAGVMSATQIGEIRSVGYEVLYQ